MSETAHQTGERPQDAASSTTAGAREVAQTVGDQTKSVVNDVREHAGDVMATARDESKRLFDEGSREFRQQAESQLTRAAGSLRTLSDRLVAMCEGRSADAGPLPDLAREMSSKLQGFASGLDQRGFDGAVQEVRRFARRRPGTFLIAAGGLGFLAGRGIRAMRDEQDPSMSEAQQPTQSMSTPPAELSAVTRGNAAEMSRI